VAQGETGRLRVGFVGSTLFTSVPVLLRQYRRNYPLVAVELHQATVARQIQLLHRQDIDVGIVRQSINDPKLRTRKLFQESFIVALPGDHPLAGQERVMLRDLAHERFVAFSRSEAPNIYSQFRHMCETGGFVPDVVQEANPLTTVVGLVAAGVGIAIVPDSMRRTRFEGVTYVELGGTRERSAFLLAWRKNDASPTLANFLETAKGVEF
jgi:DNA-binding transcriptional LysR family regulator